MRKFLFFIMTLLLFSCSKQEQDNFQHMNALDDEEQTESIIENENAADDDAESLNELDDYQLRIRNLQSEFYCNSTLFMYLDTDHYNEKITRKKFAIVPHIRLQYYQDEEWIVVDELFLENVDSSLKEQPFVIFDFKMDLFNYEKDGIYRLEVSITEDENTFPVVSEDFKLNVNEIESEPFESNEFLKLYPFNLYDNQGVFSQSGGKGTMAEALLPGCAVVAEKLSSEYIYRVPCKVLNKTTCSLNSYEDYLPEDNETVIVRKKLKEGYIDDLYEHHLEKLSGAEFSSWIFGAIKTNPIYIPSCLLSFEEMDGYIFTVTRETEEIKFYFDISEKNNGTFLRVEKIIDNQKIPLSHQFFSELIQYCDCH